MKKSTKKEVQHIIKLRWVINKLQTIRTSIQEHYESTGEFNLYEIEVFQNLYIELMLAVDESIKILERQENYELCAEIQQVYNEYSYYFTWIKETVNPKNI